MVIIAVSVDSASKIKLTGWCILLRVKQNGTYPLVYIEWEDSYGCSSDWEDLENCSPAPMVCRSVGWLIHDDQKVKVVVPHLTQTDHPNSSLQGCGDMTIPNVRDSKNHRHKDRPRENALTLLAPLIGPLRKRRSGG